MGGRGSPALKGADESKHEETKPGWSGKARAGVGRNGVGLAFQTSKPTQIP